MSDHTKPTDYTFTQTYPLALSDNQGADHRQSCKVTIDPDTIPDSTPDDVVDDLNWCIEALNAVTRYPNLVLCVSFHAYDLVLGYHDAECESSGYVRAATFNTAGDFSEDSEIDAGLLNVFDATNALYNVFGAATSTDSYSILLADLAAFPLTDHTTSHPIFTHRDGLISWGRHQCRTMTAEPMPVREHRTIYHDTDVEEAAERLNQHLEFNTIYA